MSTPAEGMAERRRALVVATASYTDLTLAKLRAPGRDASALASVLEDAALGAFEVETVLDVPADALRRRITQFCSQGGPGDLTLVYLSCHGVLDDRGRLYYATVDTDRALLAATAVPSAWLNEQLEDCRARRQILILDCCHSGAFAKGAKGASDLALRERFEGRGRVVLTGSRATEYSFEQGHVVGEGASSVFTGALVEGLRSGDADRDRDGLITVSELYDYAYELVRTSDARQTPTLWTYGAEGDLLVAHSPRGAIVEPAPLPDELTALLESARPRVRAGAVTELADLLVGPDAGRALTARAQLERVAAEDVPSVAAAARAVLDAELVAARPHPPRADPTPAAASPTPQRPPRTAVLRNVVSLAAVARAGLVTGMRAAAAHRRSAIAAVAIATAVAAVVLPTGGREQSFLMPGAFEVSGQPRGVAVGEGAVWVARHDDAKVTKIDPVSGERRSIKVAAGPDRIVAGEGAVWVTAKQGKLLERIDPKQARVTAKLTVELGQGCPDCPSPGLEIAQGALWAASATERTATEGTITKRDLRTGEELHTFDYPSGHYFQGIFAVGDDALWAVGYEGRDGSPSQRSLLVRIGFDSGRAKVVYERRTSYLNAVAYGSGKVWIADAHDSEGTETGNTVTAIDPGTRRVTGRVVVSTGITSDDIAVAEDAVLVWDPVGGGLARVHLNRRKLKARPARHGYRANKTRNERWSDLAVDDIDDGFVWISDPVGNAVHKLAYR